VEAFFQVVIFLVIVVASIWSEMSKNKSSGNSDAEFGDLTAIDDFFKQQEKSQKTSQQRPSSGGFDDDVVSLERTPAPSEPFGTPQKIQPQSGKSKRFEKQEKKRSQGKSRAGLDQRSRALPPLPSASSHFGNVESDEGACLDEAPSLTGQNNYERGGFTIARTASTTSATTRRPARRWSRQQLINAIVISELMNRYDVNRVYGRIPDRRS